jgi:secreted trypsin-like serine protease
MTIQRLLPLLLAPALTVGCAVEEPDLARSHGLPIINGAPATADHHASVVSLHYNGSSGIFCSGTLIAPDVVLTAGHCLDTAMGGKSFKTMSPALLSVYYGSAPKGDEEPYADHHIQAAETLIYPGYDRWNLLNDIALVRLVSAAPVATAPHLTQDRGFTQSDVDASVDLDFVGFGYSDTAKTQIDVKLHAVGTLGGLGCTVSGCPSYGGSSDVVATQISYAQEEEGPCNGDSGGPAFIARDGAWYVGGVTSYGDRNCTQYGASTRVDAFAGWIDERLAAWGGGGDDGGGGGGGDDGGGDDGGGDDGDDGGGDDGGACFPLDHGCDFDADCCSGKCRGKPGARTCK